MAVASICAIATILTFPLSWWVALIFAGLGLGLSVPRWLGRSWPNIVEEWFARLESAGLWRAKARRRPASITRRPGKKKGPVMKRRGKGPRKHVARAKTSSAPAVVAAPDQCRIGIFPEPSAKIDLSAAPARSLAGPPPETGRSFRQPAVLIDIDEIRQRLGANNEGSLPERTDWTLLEPTEEKVSGYRLIYGSSGDLTVITDTAYCGCGPFTDCTTGEEETGEPAEPPMPILPPAAPSGPRFSAADAETSSDDPPPDEVLPGEENIAEKEIAEVHSESVADVGNPAGESVPGVVADAELPPEPVAGIVTTEVPPTPMPAEPLMPATAPSQLPEPLPVYPATPENGAPQAEEVCTSGLPARLEDEDGGPLQPCATGNEEISGPAEPLMPSSPSAAHSGEQLPAADGEVAADVPSADEVLPGEANIVEIDIAEVYIESVADVGDPEGECAPDGLADVELPPEPTAGLGLTGMPLGQRSAVPPMSVARPSQLSEPLFSEPATPDHVALEPEEVHAPDDEEGKSNPFRPRFYSSEWMPPLDLLYPADDQPASMSPEDLIERGILIEEKLAEFRVKVLVQDAYAGPVITRYEVQPAVGVRGGQIVNLMKDLARALGMVSVRVVETIPGKTCMGLELPNPRRQMIRLSEVLSSEAFQAHDSKLAMVLGKDITGEPVVADLARAPHMLVAGTTGSGKSVGVNAMILSLLYRATPDEVRLVMIDPKMLELSIYDGIPHLLAPVVTDMKHAANALAWCVGEMERRYRLMSALRVRNLAGYNQKVREIIDARGVRNEPPPLAPDFSGPLSPLPYIVVVVDEFADLMMVAGKKIEELIARLAQKARAAGIHLILATQRPSVDVITGLIKANIPTRIAFQVSSKIDSRTILDQMGAECLLGQGDMLYLPPGTGYPQRVHGAFVADEEVQAVAEYLKQFGEPEYVEGVLGGAEDPDGEGVGAERLAEENDPLYDEAVEFVINSRRASISAIQRQLRVGYNRAARMVEQMEAAGLVSPMESNGNRTILVPAP